MSELLDYLLQNEHSFRKARLSELYSDFSLQRERNPGIFAANVSAWKRGLSSAVLAGHAPSSRSPGRNHLTLEFGDGLLRALETKQFGQPQALGLALQDALTTGEMIPLPQFLSATQSLYYRSWGRIPWTVAAWALGRIWPAGGLLGGGGGNGMPKAQVVVLVQNLEEVARAFADAIVDRTAPFERIFSRAHFQRTFEADLLQGQKLSDGDFDVLIKFLSRDKQFIAVDGNTIKIRDPADTTTTTTSEEDSAIASLKELMEQLTRQTETLRRRVDELGAAALDAVRRKDTVSARAALRSKKLAEGNLATRHATLHQLDEVAAKIQQAADNVQLVRVMEASAGVLRGLNAQVGGADRVDAVLDRLREQMGQVDEVGNVIAELGTAAVDEAEVDGEFETLLAAERDKDEAARRARRDAQEEREADETRRRLAELDRLGPTPDTTPQQQQQAVDADGRPLTPATAAADVFRGMHIGTTEDEEREKRIPAA
ncbi:putative snf7 family protein [Rosellinia necatrix]|uniref:Putative snf7 family protein n=1 Tax=Rosellinia necatrix TaxID=77044 RepID=A0A1W2TTL3_ROSNE|nr:putative snf7 family protein [Rosellinia necatrix]